MDELKQMRNEIDEIDDQMVELFQRRMAISKHVAEYKLEHKQPVQDKNREADKLDRLGALADNNFNKHGILELYRQLMAMSRKLQYRLLADKRTEEKFNFKRINELKTKNCKVIYQGVPGAYSYAAMLKFLGKRWTVKMWQPLRMRWIPFLRGRRIMLYSLLKILPQEWWQMFMTF